MRPLGSALILLCLVTVPVRLTVSQTVRANNPAVSSAALERDGQLNETAGTDAARIIFDAGVAGGIVADGCDSEKYRMLYSQGETIEKALNRLAVVTGKLKWEVRDDVVNVLVQGNEPDLLNVRVSHFDWDAKRPDDGVLPRLLQTPEVSQAAKAYGLAIGPFLGGPGVACIGEGGALEECGKDVPRLMLNEENSTVRQILNRIAKEGHTVWLYQESRCGRRNSFIIDLLEHHVPTK